MPKRKPPPEKKVWARIVNQGWEIYLTDGATLRPIEEIDRAEAAKLVRTLSVYRISYLAPVVTLTGNDEQIAMELALVDDSDEGDEGDEGAGTRLGTNAAWIFGAQDGRRALVFEFYH